MSDLSNSVTDFYTRVLPKSNLPRRAGIDLELYREEESDGDISKVIIATPVQWTKIPLERRKGEAHCASFGTDLEWRVLDCFLSKFCIIAGRFFWTRPWVLPTPNQPSDSKSSPTCIYLQVTVCLVEPRGPQTQAEGSLSMHRWLVQQIHPQDEESSSLFKSILGHKS